MSQELRARLKRLLREPAPPSGGGAHLQLPQWFRGRGPRGRSAERGAESAARSVGAAPATHDAGTVGAPRGLTEVANARGRHAVRTERLAHAHRHGAWSFGEVLAASGEALALVAGDARFSSFAAERALFLDIETTGLSGGAGTHVFLVGLGRFDGDELELWQGFARGPEEEPALLASTAERVRASATLVTFFGKAFDRHRLEDKMRIHAIAPPFASLAHLDLYHPCRRLYGGAWSDARLATCERELCGVERQRDLPGSRAPEAWFDFLAGRAHRLEDVFRHNRDDLASLVVLCAHLAHSLAERRASGAPLAGPAAARALGLARRLEAVRELGRAVEWIERACERDPSAALASERERLRARLTRAARRGRPRA